MLPFTTDTDLLPRAHWLREAAMLALAAGVAVSLDPLISGTLAIDRPASLLLSMLMALMLCAAARPWSPSLHAGENTLPLTLVLDRLHRMVRDVESHPERASAALLMLMRELFEPGRVSVVQRPGDRAAVSEDGATLFVPVPDLARPGGAGGTARGTVETLQLQRAQQGRRLFGREDARLADRIVEQLRRAVAHEQALDQGRCEERLRLAQDLHDDIGARLLSLLMQSQGSAQEDCIRRTLQDLKTLTRGLAAGSHVLSHAAGEWKAELQQRLAQVGIELEWQAEFDRDVELGVGQWSALTRVLRELVSNAIAHSHASRVWIRLALKEDRLELVMRDDGTGRSPRSWSQGLGVGGVRKRVLQLGGEIEWREAAPRGIECRVGVANWSRAAAG